MTASRLRADCARCAALCCVALAFDRSEQFAFDKPAGEPCPNLKSTCRCRIHESLAVSGFPGCAAYDCQGAGPYVTQQLFGGLSWRDDARLLAPMMDAFAQIRAILEMRGLVAAALKLSWPRREHETLEAFAARLEPAGGWTRDLLDRGAGLKLVDEIQRYLRRLGPHVRGRARFETAEAEVG
jgi:hypothetical protein